MRFALPIQSLAWVVVMGPRGRVAPYTSHSNFSSQPQAVESLPAWTAVSALLSGNVEAAGH